MENNRKMLALIAALLLACGVVGLMNSEGLGFLDSLFLTVLMFTGNFDGETADVLVNIARFGTLIFTITIILSFLDKWFKNIKDYFKARDPRTIVVYGDQDLADEFADSYKGKVIYRDDYLKTERYVLLADEDTNFHYYNKYLKGLNKEVYLKSESFPNAIIDNGHLHLFSLDEMAARKYIKENSFIEDAFDENGLKNELNIVFLGFNDLAEEFLNKMVVINIFGIDQKVNYHLFGDVKAYKQSHTNLKELNINCYEEDYLDHIEILNKSDRIIVFEDVVSVKDINKLIGCLEKGNIHIVCDDDVDNELFVNHKSGTNNRISVKTFNYEEDVCTADMIINQTGIKKAIMLNDHYNQKHPEYGSPSWGQLDTFARYSNISSADYFDFTVKEVLEKLTGKDYENVSDEDVLENLETLAKMEHMRWENYHYLNNWKYNDIKDKKLKLHNCLVPFEELTEVHKQMDRNQILEMREFEKTANSQRKR